MTSVDIALGMQIHEILLDAGIETPMNKEISLDEMLGTYQSQVVHNCQHTIMRALKLDMGDDSLKDTPKRIAKMYCQEIFTGLDYANFPKCTTVENKMGYEEMVSVNNIEVLSMCEHHFLPFVGKAHIAYLPNKKVLGLSKFNRVVDFFSRRPQIQERLTEQVALALRFILKTDDVAVVINADHYCVRLRGVKDGGSSTVTSKLTGKFRENPALRQEFLALTRS